MAANLISPEVERMAGDEMQPGERVVWSGAPSPKRMAMKALPIVLFGIPVTVFIVFWIYGASGFWQVDFSSGWMLLVFLLFWLPFLLVELGLLTSPFWIGRRAAKTGYFITNKRAVLMEKRLVGGYKVRSFYPKDLGAMERVQQADGSGDIILALESRAPRRGGSQTKAVGFFGVPEVRSVEQLLTRLERTAEG